MVEKRPGCIAEDEPGHYRNGSRYEHVADIRTGWMKKIAWDKIEWDLARGKNAAGGGYYIRTNVMNSIRTYLGKDTPFGSGATWKQAMLLKIPPGCSLIVHNDACFEDTAFDRYHIPITTNDLCACYMHIPGTSPEEFTSHHCEVGKVYKMDPTILHYSENLGETDRIHLCVDLVAGTPIPCGDSYY